ncbi:hypothetical protein PG994_014490 [Apiospora phragmitis]|uniref:FAD-binding domain-containing protein n=1 Tax=Apiospora phragmitis TaxID=2905665 RepID=A0ABR1T4F7_9PEZI
MHPSKWLERIARAGTRGSGGGDKDNGPVILHFADGSTRECDVLIGADGIRSTIRKIVLGDDGPAAHPRNAGGGASWPSCRTKRRARFWAVSS